MGRCPPEREAEFIEDCERLTVASLSAKYERANSTIREWRIELFREGRLLWWPGIRLHAEEPEWEPSIVWEGDCMAVSDVEVPFHDPKTLGYLVAIAMKFHIKALVIAGDFLALDSESYWPTEEGMEERTLADDKWSGADVVGSLLEWFDTIIIVKGNHEQRGTKKRELGLLEDLRRQWGELGDVELSLYKWCLVESGGEVFRLEHFGNYSKVPGSVARERALIENCHILGGHTHHCSWSVACNGQMLAIDLGHATREETRFYKTVNGTTRHPKWVKGFAMIRNGYVTQFATEFTDWSLWLKEMDLERGVGND